MNRGPDLAQTGYGGDDSEDFRTDLNTYRRLRYRLAECESAGSFDEALVDEIVTIEDRLMATVATSLAVILTKFEIATCDLSTIHHPWVATIRADIMHLGGLDSSPLGIPLF